ncbi:hypothetical protein [Metamycoplasma hyosynoviae]|uniref:hypothetical protein n=1 Tax=Metamycoplasma hyosynoviae TaxID=29559 RepID=UPI000461C58B|nr:hypothetical protein [Metamycoplasma hyosynoviae]KDE42838.1 hypothetical protein NPL1_02470 [Metamycoplasma hyosynoviae]MDC8921847.1 hypothetical protein [Metamycoplasma hyosynoviae]MDC8962282.1 hypothetical protein [Metamycoplasma hyosynoviae]MDD1372986.1 hypothetical protein [Metamycoplasma hyosynoviae]MDD1378989.1 hypothetical protein [Metamycoplasma hyosynoviae]
MENFRKLSLQEMKNVEGGFAVSSFITTLMTQLIPAGINIVGSIVGLVKSSSSVKGEIKQKDSDYKWDNVENITVNTPMLYCI